MELAGYFQELTEAITHAFDDNQLTMLLKFKLDIVFDNVVGPGPFKKRVFDLLSFLDGDGRLDELYLATLIEKPRNPRLRALAQRMASDLEAIQHGMVETVLNMAVRNQDDGQGEKIREELSRFETNGSLQAIVVAAPGLPSGQDLVTWMNRMNECRSQVCSIGRNNRHAGTGFLVGPDRIMTNSHVVDPTAIDSYDVVFDYLKGTDRSRLPTYRVQDELSRSEPREFDYVILSLDRATEANRKYFRPRRYQFKNIREPISVMGFPNGDPLSFSYGVIYDNNSLLGRVAYTANTAPGSSGSPVFGENWDLVAIHHHGEANVNNHGIPIMNIYEHLTSQGLGQLLDVSL